MSKTPRVSTDQRWKMLEFMQAHEDLARGRVAGADTSRRKSSMLSELATLLNSIGGGAKKTPEKWWKSWQDWRSDTKAKALKVKKYRGGTGGGPGPAPLTQMEETLLQFCGVEMVEGVQGVADPLEAEAGISENDMTPMAFSDIQYTVDVFGEEVPNSSTRPEENRRATKNNNDQKLNEILERQAAALEQLPKSIDNLADVVATGLQGIATAMSSIARALEQQQVAIILNKSPITMVMHILHLVAETWIYIRVL